MWPLQRSTGFAVRVVHRVAVPSSTVHGLPISIGSGSRIVNNNVAHSIAQVRCSRSMHTPVIRNGKKVLLSIQETRTATSAAFVALGLGLSATRRVHAEWVELSLKLSTTSTTPKPIKKLRGKRIVENQSIAKRWLTSAWRLLMDMVRAGQLLFLFLPCTLAYPFMYSLGTEKTQQMWADLLVSTLTQAGPAFVKLGQWASTRSDVLPTILRRRLIVLRHSVSPEPWSATVKTLEKLPQIVRYTTTDTQSDSCCVFSVEKSSEFPVSTANDVGAVVPRRDATSIEKTVRIDSVESTPLGAGCIAQVHRANGTVLDSQGNETAEHVLFAIKVRRRNVESMISRDLSLLRTAAWIVESLFDTVEWLALEDSVDLFADFLMEQVDLNTEAANLKRFRSNFSSQEHISFPNLIHSSVDCMIESLECGQLLSKLLDEDKSDLMMDMNARKSIARLGVEAFLKMLIEDNFIHSDLHPGNIICQLDQTSTPKLVFLDVGMCTELSKQDQLNFLELFFAVARGRGTNAAQLILSRSRKTIHGQWVPEGCIDPDGFVRSMDKLVSKVTECTFTLGTVDVGAVLRDVLHLVRKHKVELDPNFTSLVMSIIVLEGVGRELDPNLDLFALAIPILRRNLTSRASARLRKAFN